MFNEIRFSEYVDTGKLIDEINLPDFFKVYLNHRPPFGNTMSGIQQSFDVLGFTNSKGKKAIRREDFLKLLLTKGKSINREYLVTSLGCCHWRGAVLGGGRPPGIFNRWGGGLPSPKTMASTMRDATC